MHPKPKIVVADFGGYRNYAVPIVFEWHNMLSHYFTGAYAGKGWLRSVYRLCSSTYEPIWAQRLARRRAEIPRGKVTAYNILGIRDALKRRASSSRFTSRCLRTNTRFGSMVARDMLGLDTNSVYGIPLGSKEVFKAAKHPGWFCVLDQNAMPLRIESAIAGQEASLWPGFEEDYSCSAVYSAILERAEEEISLADAVICPSEYVSNAMRQFKKPGSICVVSPGLSLDRFEPDLRGRRHGPLRVLYVGGIRLQKGFQYLAKAAGLLGGKVEVCMVGNVLCDADRVSALLPENVKVVGPKPYNDVQSYYRWADVFCLPSLAEGSARVTHEALACGLPVICTREAGSIVRDRIDGFLVPIRDSEAIADRLSRLHDDHDLLQHMSCCAVARAQKSSLLNYGSRLVQAITSLLQNLT